MDSYERKVSSEEAREGYILVLKDRLTFFPPPGEPFEVRDGGIARRVSIEAVDCECRGPEKPHQHFRLPWPGLAPGGRVRLTRRPGEAAYDAKRLS